MFNFPYAMQLRNFEETNFYKLKICLHEIVFFCIKKS